MQTLYIIINKIKHNMKRFKETIYCGFGKQHKDRLDLSIFLLDEKFNIKDYVKDGKISFRVVQKTKVDAFNNTHFVCVNIVSAWPVQNKISTDILDTGINERAYDYCFTLDLQSLKDNVTFYTKSFINVKLSIVTDKNLNSMLVKYYDNFPANIKNIQNKNV